MKAGFTPQPHLSIMRALVFDLDGTLLQFDRPYESVLETAFRSVCGRVEDDWLERYDSAFGEAFARQVQRPAEYAFEATPAPGDPAAFAGALLDAECQATAPPEKALSALESLSTEFSVGVLTNGPDEWQRTKLRATELDGLFDAVVTSYEAGAHKPKPEPYETVETRLGAKEYAMIGDSDSDVDGARAVGWHALRYTGQQVRTVPQQLSWE